MAIEKIPWLRQRRRRRDGFTRRKGGCTTLIAAAALAYILVVGTSVVGAARDSSKGYDADLTLFSPEGRLYQVEYVMRAVGYYGCPAVGVHGEGCCVVACKRDLPDDLVYPDSVTSIFRITDDIYSASTGMPGDVRYQVKRARLQALEYKRQYGTAMPSRLLTLAMADAAQVNTQHAAMRPMACVSFVISVDDEDGPILFRLEPSGQVFQAWGTAAGRGSAASVEFMEEAYKSAREGAGDAKNANRSDEEEGDEYRDPTRTTGDSSPGQKPPTNEKARSASVARSGCESYADGEVSSPESSPSTEEEGRKAEATAGGRRALEGRDSSREAGAVTGFGLVGEDDTVELALQALSKSCSGKDAGPLTAKNVEIAIASKETGIRVCSRAEVKGFLGRMACSPRSPPKLGR